MLARKYNLNVRKSMRSGAVVRMNASQLAVVQNDEGVDHLSGDARIQSQSLRGVDVTAESIGAGSTMRRAIDGASELVIGMFRASAEKL